MASRSLLAIHGLATGQGVRGAAAILAGVRVFSIGAPADARGLAQKRPAGAPPNVAVSREHTPVYIYRHRGHCTALRRKGLGRISPGPRPAGCHFLYVNINILKAATIVPNEQNPRRRLAKSCCRRPGNREARDLVDTHKSRDDPIRLAWMVKEVEQLARKAMGERPHPACRDGESGFPATAGSPRSCTTDGRTGVEETVKSARALVVPPGRQRAAMVGRTSSAFRLKPVLRAHVAVLPEQGY